MFRIFKVLLNFLAPFPLLPEPSHHEANVPRESNLTRWPLFLPADATDSPVLHICLGYSVRGAQTLVIFPSLDDSLFCGKANMKTKKTNLKLRIRVTFIRVEHSQNITI